MEISKIGIKPTFNTELNTNPNTNPNQAVKPGSFAQTLDHYLKDVNNTLKDSEKLTTQMITGEGKNLHNVMIAAQKASVALQLTVTVRDKALEAYQEVMRMQI
jgi:flagellar hook-basal body complex protein FliE